MANILNGNQGQICSKNQPSGKFNADQELYDLIVAAVNPRYGINSISRIGIQAPIATHVLINDIDFEIGKTGILEARELSITSIKFVEDTDNSVIIDFIIDTKY